MYNTLPELMKAFPINWKVYVNGKVIGRIVSYDLQSLQLLVRTQIGIRRISPNNEMFEYSGY